MSLASTAHVQTALWGFLAPMAGARSLRNLILIAGAFVVLVLVFVGMGWIGPRQVATLRAFVFVPGLPVAAAILAELALRDGIEQKTLLYPLLGPVPRATLAWVRTIVTAAILWLGATLVVAILTPLSEASWTQLPQEATALFLGALTYTAFFGLIHLVSRRGLIVSLVIYGIFDDPLSRLPFSIREVAPAYHLRNLADLEEVMRIPIIFPLTNTPVLNSVLYLAIATIVCLGLLTVLFNRKNLGELC